MITAALTHHENYLQVVFVFPNLKKTQVLLPGADPEKLVGEARRLMYFKNRDYVLQKLTSWLNQRLFAFNITYRQSCSINAAKLILVLGHYRDASFFNVCKVVADHRCEFEALAPWPSSGHFKAWEKNILPIISFCSDMKEGKL